MPDRLNTLMAVAAYCRAAGLSGTEADRVYESFLGTRAPDKPSDFYDLLDALIEDLRAGTLRRR